MRNQFFYTIKRVIAPGAPGSRANDEPIEITQWASFNMEKVIRTLELEDGTMVVLLDDFHSEFRQGMSKNQNGKDIVKTMEQTMQSEIVLSAEDKVRFYRVTAIEYFPETNPSILETVR